ncbi:Nuclear cap-binding protein subunit 2 [Bonamia ostreae]|uniref:Nuclear cap-binding protein subunit 2 n=1 Tax=Bonamia ostreae TaxID=126728 RepID=A0ABV2AQK2_9EUKA
MSFLYSNPNALSPYLKSRKNLYSEEGWNKIVERLQSSCTLYIGNLSFTTTEEQLYALFSKIASVKRVILGKNRFNGKACGFCFVDYYTPEDTKSALKYLNNMKLDGKTIRVDQDPGFEEGRQFGRGKHGGQVREEHRTDYDSKRGGWGHGDTYRPKRKRNFNSGGKRPQYKERKYK